MDKEAILAKSRQENKEQDLYELSIETKAYRVAFIVAEVATALLILIKMIMTGEWDLSLLIIDATMEAVFNYYKAIKMKDSKSLITAIACTILDVAIIVLVVCGLL